MRAEEVAPEDAAADEADRLRKVLKEDTCGRCRHVVGAKSLNRHGHCGFCASSPWRYQ